MFGSKQDAPAVTQIPAGMQMMIKALGIDPSQMITFAGTLAAGLKQMDDRLSRIEANQAVILAKLDARLEGQ